MSNSQFKSFAKLIENPWCAYIGIFLLQLKVMWRIWDYRDLTPGDASEYFFKLIAFLEEGSLDIVWSPLYTIFLAGLHGLTDNLFQVSILAQVIIAVTASLLVLALFRRLLPGYLAWLFAAWWTLLPINFDTVYNVHLFSVLLPLALFVLAASKPSTLGRGTILAGLLLAALLVRTEYLAVFFLWLLVVPAYEFFRLRRENGHRQVRDYLIGYGLPLLISCLLLGGFYSAANSLFRDVRQQISGKTTLYVCQNYAYSKLQQGDSWKGDPWTECQELIERDFGQPTVTYAEALLRNPWKMLENIWWNIKLIPNGTQLALFNHYAGGINPDFMRARKFSLVIVPFLLVVASAGFGLLNGLIIPAIRKRHINNGLAWLLMGATALAALAVMLMVRPRPSYMFPYSIFLLALTGLGLARVLEASRLNDVVKKLGPVLAIFLLLLVPSYYDEEYVSHFGGRGQGWKNVYEQLAPHVGWEGEKAPLILLPLAGNYQSLCNYLGADCQVLEKISPGKIESLQNQGPGQGAKNLYLLFLEGMLREYSSPGDKKEALLPGYVELQCFSLKDMTLTCSDGTVDLDRGIINDGSSDIPLRAALFIDRGNLLRKIIYRENAEYFLQIHLRNNRFDMIQVTDETLFNTRFNQYYMAGNFDHDIFVDEYKNFPEIRLLKFKGTQAMDTKSTSK